MLIIFLSFLKVVILGLSRNLTSFHSWVCPYSPKITKLQISQISEGEIY